MRLASVLMFLLALGLCTGAAFANPINDDGQKWESIWTSPRATIPEAEPNNPCPTSQAVTLGDIVDPATITSGDVDYYKIYLLTTDRLSVITDKATGCTVGMDTQVYIYRDDCTTQIAWDDDLGPGLYSYAAGSWTPPYDGYYYVKVNPYSAGTGCYKVWFFAGASATGACCSTAGACTITAPGSCTATGSIWLGPGTLCSPNPCPAPGACCNPTTGACTLTLQAGCAAPNVWHAEWTVCSPNPCPQPQPGACCNLTAHTCTMTSPSACVSPSVFLGVGVPCDPNPCLPPVNDTCAGAIPICGTGNLAGTFATATNDYSLTSAGCTGFTTAGPDLTYQLDLQAGDVVNLSYTCTTGDAAIYIVRDCSDILGTCEIGADDTVTGQAEVIGWTVTNTGTYYLILDAYTSTYTDGWTLVYSIPCPPPMGACCDIYAACAMTTQANCLTPSVWYPGTICDPNPCPPPMGACCCPDGTCMVLPEAQCVAPCIWMGAGTDCDPNPCPGACCDPFGACRITTQDLCVTPDVWIGAWGCDPNPCPQQPVGACCYPNGDCVLTQELQCTGIWHPEWTICDPNPCPQPMGACCAPDGGCVISDAAHCLAPNVWHAEWVVCDPNPCPQPPQGACCNLATGECALTTQAGCLSPLVWHAEWTTCSPNPCQVVPTEKTSWGQIKNKYR